MTAPKRATVYIDPSIHKALKLKAVETDTSVSDLINLAVKGYLREDADDLMVFDIRKNEPSSDFEDFLKVLRRERKI